MSTARFTAAIAVGLPTVDIDPDSVVQGSLAGASLKAKAIALAPSRHYVWIYDVSGVKVDVIA